MKPRVTGLRGQVFVRRGPREYAAQLAELPGGGFDCVLESLGGRYLDASLAALEPMGRLITFGATHSYGGASGGFLKWLTLVPGHLLRRTNPRYPLHFDIIEGKRNGEELSNFLKHSTSHRIASHRIGGP